MTPTSSSILRFCLTYTAAAAALCAAIAGCATPTPSLYGTPLSQSGLASKPQNCPEIAAPPELAKQLNYRQVVVSAHSQNNQPLPKLTAKDLHLYQGNNQLQIAFFKPQPATVGILVDTSGSMQPKLPICRAALKNFINDLDSSDQIFLLAFSDRVSVLVKPTTDHVSVIKSLDALHAWGRTALYDSVTQALETISDACTKTRAIVLLTDGMDTASSSSLKDVEHMARTTDARIYSIGIGNPGSNLMGMGISPYTSSPIALYGTIVDDRVDTEALDKLGQDSGGHAYFVGLDDNGEALKQSAGAISNKIGRQYLVGFVGDGSTSQLRVQAPGKTGVTLKILTH